MFSNSINSSGRVVFGNVRELLSPIPLTYSEKTKDQIVVQRSLAIIDGMEAPQLNGRLCDRVDGNVIRQCDHYFTLDISTLKQLKARFPNTVIDFHSGYVRHLIEVHPLARPIIIDGKSAFMDFIVGLPDGTHLSVIPGEHDSLFLYYEHWFMNALESIIRNMIRVSGEERNCMEALMMLVKSTCFIHDCWNRKIVFPKIPELHDFALPLQTFHVLEFEEYHGDSSVRFQDEGFEASIDGDQFTVVNGTFQCLSFNNAVELDIMDEIIILANLARDNTGHFPRIQACSYGAPRKFRYAYLFLTSNNFTVSDDIESILCTFMLAPGNPKAIMKRSVMYEIPRISLPANLHKEVLRLSSTLLPFEGRCLEGMVKYPS